MTQAPARDNTPNLGFIKIFLFDFAVDRVGENFADVKWDVCTELSFGHFFFLLLLRSVFLLALFHPCSLSPSISFVSNEAKGITRIPWCLRYYLFGCFFNLFSILSVPVRFSLIYWTWARWTKRKTERETRCAGCACIIQGSQSFLVSLSCIESLHRAHKLRGKDNIYDWTEIPAFKWPPQLFSNTHF